MTTYKQVLWSDIPVETANELIKDIQLIVQLYTVALLKISHNANQGKKVIHIGSGTLISIGEVYGILTAQHVARELDNDSYLGLVIAKEGQEHEFTIPKANLNILDIGTPQTEKNGPDLSFIAIPIHKVGTIKATKHFYPMLLSKDYAIENDKPVAGFWCICGSPETMTLSEDSQVFDEVLSFCIYCGIGGVPTYDENDDWDYCEIAVDHEYSNNIPPKFNGVSGGGLWQIIVTNEKNNLFKIKDHILSGVVFWQSQREGDFRNLRCHGRKSIYKKLIDTIQKAGIIQ